MRILKIAASAALAACVASSAQADPWSVWLAKNKSALEAVSATKDKGIHNLSSYRDQVCRAQKTEDDKRLCVNRFNGTIARRQEEKKIVDAIRATTKLGPDDQDVLIAIVYPVYQQKDAQTTSLANQLLRDYPQH